MFSCETMTIQIVSGLLIHLKYSEYKNSNNTFTEYMALQYSLIYWSKREGEYYYMHIHRYTNIHHISGEHVLIRKWSMSCPSACMSRYDIIRLYDPFHWNTNTIFQK